jgi:putative ABC transport system permease protein
VTLGLLVGGIVAAATFAASLDRLVTDPGRSGSNYTFALEGNEELTGSDMRQLLEPYPDIAGLMILTGAEARCGGITLDLIGVEHVKGDLAPARLVGRLPAGPDEVALGRVTAGELDLEVGDELELTGPGGAGVYRVVGLAVVPGFAGYAGVGQGGVMTAEGLLRLQPAPDASLAAITLRSGAPADTGERLGAVVGQTPGLQDPPSEIVNVARVRRIPAMLAVVLGILALLTLVHALLVSIQSRSRDLAVLRALGANPPWIGRAVHWQATVLTATPLLLGVPLGLIGGTVVFRAFANSIGAVPEPATPLLAVAAIAVGLIAIANLAAVLPARRARRLATVEMLQAD